jgi:hypothetical protein
MVVFGAMKNITNYNFTSSIKINLLYRNIYNSYQHYHFILRRIFIIIIQYILLDIKLLVLVTINKEERSEKSYCLDINIR